MGVAADGLAAVAVVGEELGFVADANLAHFDAGLKLASEVLDEIAEVDSFLGEEEDDAFAAEELLDINELHGKLALLDESPASVQLAILVFVDFLQRVEVRRRRGAEDAAAGGLGEQLHGAGRGLAKDFTQLHTAFR